jgi:hypothetical protein
VTQLGSDCLPPYPARGTTCRARQCSRCEAGPITVQQAFSREGEPPRHRRLVVIDNQINQSTPPCAQAYFPNRSAQAVLAPIVRQGLVAAGRACSPSSSRPWRSSAGPRAPAVYVVVVQTANLQLNEVAAIAGAEAVITSGLK